MDSNLGIIVVSVIGSTAFSSFITYFFMKKKNTADTNDVISQTYERLLKSCLSEIERLKLRLEEFEKSIEEYEMLRKENFELKLLVEELRKN